MLATRDIWHKKARMLLLPFLGEPIIFIGNSSTLVLRDHFWGVNSCFVLISSTKIASVILGKTPPKAMEWGWVPPPLYGRSPQFCDFFALMASLITLVSKGCTARCFSFLIPYGNIYLSFSGPDPHLCGLLQESLRPNGPILQRQSNDWGGQ